MTFEDILHFMKKLRLYIVSIHQKRFINECDRKDFLLNSRNDVKTDFFVRFRRTYVLKNVLFHIKFSADFSFISFDMLKFYGWNF